MTEFPTKGRGTQGVIAMVTNDRNGRMVGAVQVFDGEEVMLISDQGTLVRTHVNEVSLLGRNTQGVTLIRVSDKEKLVGLERICDPEDDEAVLAALAEGDDTVVSGASADTPAAEADSSGSDDLDDDGVSTDTDGTEANDTEDNGDDVE